VNESDYRRVVLGVALATALACLPLLGAYPLFDPDEAYYPATASESMAAGSPLDLRLDGEPRWNKPPLSYALIEVSFAAFGRNEFAARLPSVLEGAALVAVVGLLVLRTAGRRTGLFAALVLASAVGFQIMTRAAHPEMGLVLGTAAAQLLLAEWFTAPPEARPRAAPWLAGAAMGWGFLAKGPVVLALPALMLVAGMLVFPAERRPTWRETGRVFGIAAALALAIAAPWYLWMGARHDSFWAVAFGEIGVQAAKEPEGFRANPLFFTACLVAGFLPWSFFLPGALRRIRRVDASRRESLRLLMALAAGSALLFWTALPARNPHYALVFLPPLAVVVAVELRSGAGRTDHHVLLRSRLPCIALAALGAFVAYSPNAFKLYTATREEQPLEDGTSITITVPGDTLRDDAVAMSAYLGGVMLGAAGLAGIFARSQSWRAAIVAAAWVAIVPGALTWWREWDHQERGMKDFAAVVAARAGPGDPVVAYRARVPSLSFYSARRVARPSEPEELRRIMDAAGNAWVVLRDRHRLALDLAGGGAPLIPRLEEVARRGEWSLVRER
jgi:hypothetical protein